MLSVPGVELATTPQTVEGLLGTASPIVITITSEQTIQLTADYDAGIR